MQELILNSFQVRAQAARVEGVGRSEEAEGFLEV